MPDQLLALAGDNADAIDRETIHAPRLAAALEAVIELHEPEDFCDEYCASGFMCVECLDDDGSHMLFPCPTVQAITDAIGGGDHGCGHCEVQATHPR